MHRVARPLLPALELAEQANYRQNTRVRDYVYLARKHCDRLCIWRRVRTYSVSAYLGKVVWGVADRASHNRKNLEVTFLNMEQA